MLHAYVSYFTNVHICIMGAQSWDGAQTAQNILDLDGNPMFVGIWGPNLSTNSSLEEVQFQRNRSATPPPQSRWPLGLLAPAAWPLALAWLACHCWGPEFESNGESLMCYHAMKIGGFIGPKCVKHHCFTQGMGTSTGNRCDYIALRWEHQGAKVGTPVLIECNFHSDKHAI